MFLSAAIVVIRLRSPRPRGRRLWSQPGYTGCVAALIGAAVNAGARGAPNFTLCSACPSTTPWRGSARAGPTPGPAVLGAWLALILSRRWRPEQGAAIDRLGRLIGLLWIIELAFSELPGSRWFLVIDRYIWKHWR